MKNRLRDTKFMFTVTFRHRYGSGGRKFTTTHTHTEEARSVYGAFVKARRKYRGGSFELLSGACLPPEKQVRPKQLVL